MGPFRVIFLKTAQSEEQSPRHSKQVRWWTAWNHDQIEGTLHAHGPWYRAYSNKRSTINHRGEGCGPDFHEQCFFLQKASDQNNFVGHTLHTPACLQSFDLDHAPQMTNGQPLKYLWTNQYIPHQCGWNFFWGCVRGSRGEVYGNLAYSKPFNSITLCFIP